jgi:hypothetical protein
VIEVSRDRECGVVHLQPLAPHATFKMASVVIALSSSRPENTKTLGG